MAFKASPAGKGLVFIHGVEAFIEKFIERKFKEAKVEERIGELRKLLKLDGKAAAAMSKPAPVAKPEPVPAPKSPVAKKAKPAKASKAKPAATATDPLEALLSALDGHAKKAALIKAGKQKDQLLRSLIPLYVGQKLALDISSGTTSKFWAKHGVKFAAPNAAKVLREQKGYAKRAGSSVQITPSGVSYVEAALKK
jgi:hypothetical protein